MAWRRYPKYEKKKKTYNEYLHLSLNEITRRQKYFLEKIEEIEKVIPQILEYQKIVWDYNIEIKNSIQSSVDELNYLKERLENLKTTGSTGFWKNMLTSQDYEPEAKIGIEKLKKDISEKYEEIDKKIFEKVKKLEMKKKFTINKKQFEVGLSSSIRKYPGEVNYYTNTVVNITDTEDFDFAVRYAKSQIPIIKKYLEPINKAYEIIERRHTQTEEKISKIKEKGDKYKAHAYAHQQKTRDLSEEVKREIKDQEKIFPLCPYCEQSLGLEPHADHIYPVTSGGLGTKGNMVYVCAKCNQEKSALTLREFIKKKGLERIRVENNLELLGKKF